MRRSPHIPRKPWLGWTHHAQQAILSPPPPVLQPEIPEDTGPEPLPGFHDPEAAAASFPEFIRQAWPILEPGAPLVWGWHLDCFCLHLDAVAKGQIQNIIFNVPPGCTKTLVISVMWPAFMWLHQPWLRWLCAANEDSLVTRDAVACRRLIESDEYQAAWGHVFHLTSDQNVKTLYENNHRGHRTSTTVGSSVTGKKGDILIVDDPNDAKKVHSKAERDKVNSWWDNGFYNRVNHFKTARRVLIGQKTHKDDLFGHIAPTGEFELVAIPEEFEVKRRFATSIKWQDPRTKEGDLLREDRFGPEEVRKAKRRLGSVGYAQQHQQRGTAPDGKYFKEEWFAPFILNDAGDGFVFPCDGRMVLRPDCVVFLVIDPATGSGPTGDLTAVGVFAYSPDTGRLMILEMVSRLIPIANGSADDLVSITRRWMKKYDAAFVSVESDGFMYAVAKEIREQTGVPVREISHENKGKLTRAQQAIIMAEAGDIFIPPDADWVVDFLEELTSFTGQGTNEIDNQVDVLAYACKEAERMSPGNDEPMSLGTGRRG